MRRLLKDKSHPNNMQLCTGTFADYEDLRLAVGNGTAIGTNAVGLGETIDATIYETEQGRGCHRIEDFVMMKTMRHTYEAIMIFPTKLHHLYIKLHHYLSWSNTHLKPSNKLIY